jgi:hypothetical protein
MTGIINSKLESAGNLMHIQLKIVDSTTGLLDKKDIKKLMIVQDMDRASRLLQLHWVIQNMAAGVTDFVFAGPALPLLPTMLMPSLSFGLFPHFFWQDNHRKSQTPSLHAQSIVGLLVCGMTATSKNLHCWHTTLQSHTFENGFADINLQRQHEGGTEDLATQGAKRSVKKWL